MVETTGLADPAPILYTIFTDPVLQHHFSVDLVLTTVDALNGNLHLDHNPESLKQVAAADKIVVTKTDIAEACGVRDLLLRLGTINPSAGSSRPPHLGDFRRSYRLDGVRYLVQHAVAHQGSECTVRERSPGRRRAGSRRPQRRAAHHPLAGAPRRVTRRGPPLADHLHHEKHPSGGDHEIPGSLRRVARGATPAARGRT